ncbi:transmembrane protein [methanogenic archaeon ISO4-H5]|nr:transmembrane protein [methanogenic archaeon ISO4-H5]
MAKIGKFSRKYGLFLSNASNEEIVSVSKELMNGLSAEMKVTHNTSVALLATSMVTLIMMISLISGMSSTLIGTAKSIILLTKITAIAMVCISAVLSAKVIMSMSDASFVATILWRNVRETADDESAYEQTQAIRVIGSIMTVAKQYVKLAALAIAVAVILLGAGYIYETLAVAGYL